MTAADDATPLRNWFAAVRRTYRGQRRPAAIRAAVVAAYEAGWTYQQIADAMGISVEGARYHAGRHDGRTVELPSPPAPLTPRRGRKARITTTGEALDRVSAAGWYPAEPYSGRLTQPWLVKCRTCGEVARLVPTPHMRACTHAAAREAAAIRRGDTAHYLQLRNLRPLEPLDGDNGRLWVQCQECGRCWHTTAADPARCWHTGTGAPTPPLPEPKKTEVPKQLSEETPPPGYTGLPIVKSQLHAMAFFAWLGALSDTGEMAVFVHAYAGVPEPGPKRLCLAVLPGMDPYAEARDHLAAHGWAIRRGAHWGEVPAHDGAPGYRVELDPGWATPYDIARDLMHSTARSLYKAGQSAMERRKIRPHAHYTDPGGTEWPLYHRAYVRAILARSAGDSAPGT